MLLKLRVSEMRDIPSKEFRKSLIRRAILEIAVYLIYLLSTFILALATRDDTMFSLHGMLTKHFIDRPINSPHNKTNTYYDIVTREEWWDYIEQVFLESLHENKSSKVLSHFVLEENLLLGPPRLRQKRVRPHTCEVHDHFEEFFDECYGHFTAKNEETSDNYKGTKYLPSTNFDVLHMGVFTHFTDGGYVQDLTYDAEENKKIFEKLKNDEWFDRATRLIVLEFVCFNDNIKLFDNFKLSAEMPSIGGLLTDVHNEVIDFHTFWTKPDNYFIWVTCAIFYGCLVYYIFEELIELIHCGWSYFCAFWNYMDLCMIILCLYCAVYHFWHAWLVEKLIKQFLDNPDEYLNIDELAYFYSTYLSVYSCSIFVQCFRCFKYFNFNTTLLQFTTTLHRCVADILGFCLMFGIIIVAYALVGMLFFGSHNVDFRDVKHSTLTIVKMMVGKFDYDELEETNRVVGPIFFVTFIFVMFFVMTNMFLAILAHTYLTVKQEIRVGVLDLSSFLSVTFKEWLHNVKHTISISFLKEPHSDRRNTIENEFNRTYFEIVGPHTNLESKAKHAQDLKRNVKRLEQRLLLVELAMEELLEKLDVILEENNRMRKKENDIIS